jgi:hypothetical protein
VHSQKLSIILIAVILTGTQWSRRILRLVMNLMTGKILPLRYRYGQDDSTNVDTKVLALNIALTNALGQ